jgi:transposase-like protein
MITHVLVTKYCDHVSLYRLEQIFAQRHGIHLPRQTLARWVELAAEMLKPIYDQIRTGVLAGGYVQMDETSISYLEPGNGKTKKGYLWVACRPSLSGKIGTTQFEVPLAYHFCPSRHPVGGRARGGSWWASKANAAHNRDF